MSTALLGIDHTIVGVRDLEAGRAAWTRLGFTATPRGSHIGWGTANYCIMFEADYIELLGIVDPTQFTNRLDEFLDDREGLIGLAFGAGDVDAFAAGLKKLGVGFDGPNDLKRNLELDEGTVQPAFRLVFPVAEAVPGLSAFACQHLTPELVRRPGWLKHPNGAAAIRSVTVVAERPADYVEAYERLLGAGSCVMTDDMLTVHTGGALILFTPADLLETLHPMAAADPAIKAPYPAAMTLAVADPEATAASLKGNGVPFDRQADGSVAVAAEYATGVWLEFAAIEAAPPTA